MSITSKSRFRVARNDIRAWKVFLVRGDILHSPIWDGRFEIGKRYDHPSSLQKEHYGIGAGFHMFADEKSAWDYFKYRGSYFTRNITVVRCTIPRGTRYIKGTNSGMPSYVTESFIPDRIYPRYNKRGIAHFPR